MQPYRADQRGDDHRNQQIALAASAYPFYRCKQLPQPLAAETTRWFSAATRDVTVSMLPHQSGDSPYSHQGPPVGRTSDPAPDRSTLPDTRRRVALASIRWGAQMLRTSAAPVRCHALTVSSIAGHHSAGQISALARCERAVSVAAGPGGHVTDPLHVRRTPIHTTSTCPLRANHLCVAPAGTTPVVRAPVADRVRVKRSASHGTTSQAILQEIGAARSCAPGMPIASQLPQRRALDADPGSRQRLHYPRCGIMRCIGITRRISAGINEASVRRGWR